MKEYMNAVVLDKVTNATDIVLSKKEIPEVKPGWLLIRVKAFGMNHSEQILRLEEIKYDYIKKPIVPGIECVGEVVDESNTRFKKGQKVMALMGGMGRSFDGAYAEYALLPEKIVFSIESDLSWSELGAIPETYFTAWGSLFEALNLQKDDTLLIRGASCALGYAAIQLAKALGSKVIATTHKESKLELIDEADECLIDDGHLSGKLKGVTKALDLVGPKCLLDTMRAVEKGAFVCHTGILGGVYVLNNFDPIKDIPNGVYLTSFYSNYPTQKQINDIYTFLKVKDLKPKFDKLYKFSDIKSAILMQESGQAKGKIVVEMD